MPRNTTIECARCGKARLGAPGICDACLLADEQREAYRS